MKSFKKYITDKDLQLNPQSPEMDSLKEGVLAGSVISAKLISMNKKVKSEQDLAKKIDLLADMVAFGSGSVAFATNYRGKKR